MEDSSGNPETGDLQGAVAVFRGSMPACADYGLMLEARGVPYERIEAGGEWVLTVAPAVAAAAIEEIRRYAAERPNRPPRATLVPYGGSGIGAALYAAILLLTAYCTGIAAFGVDWFEAGALDARPGGGGEWWRALTALTLHLDQEHLLGNLLFGVGVGTLAGRMFGPGVAWLAILGAGAAANYVDMLVSPGSHRAVGASTALFAALGLLSGFGWGGRRDVRERRLYRWGPLFAGVCLLALLGAGNEHVDVLGHLLGFTAGIGVGWSLARAELPRNRRTSLQWAAGAVAVALLGGAWALALGAARH